MESANIKSRLEIGDPTITIGEKYQPIFDITSDEEAQIYKGLCIQHTMYCDPKISKERALDIENQNIGYYTGYGTTDDRLRIERLFNCSHPIFGKAEDGIPTPEEAFNAGVKFGQS